MDHHVRSALRCLPYTCSSASLFAVSVGEQLRWLSQLQVLCIIPFLYSRPLPECLWLNCILGTNAPFLYYSVSAAL